MAQAKHGVVLVCALLGFVIVIYLGQFSPLTLASYSATSALGFNHSISVVVERVKVKKFDRWSQLNKSNRNLSYTAHGNFNPATSDNRPHVKPSTQTVFFSSAFTDYRFGRRQLRLFGLIHKNATSHSFKCVFNDTETYMNLHRIYDEWPENPLLLAVLGTCHLPDAKAEDFVKVVLVPNSAGKLEYSVTLPVQNGPIEAHSDSNDTAFTVALCVKPISGNLNPNRILEWFLIHRKLGVQYFAFYIGHVDNPEIKDQLDSLLANESHAYSWVKYDFINDVINDIQMTGTVSEYERYGVNEQGTIVALNECMYWLASQYSHVLVVDLDELFIPASRMTIPEMLVHLQKDPNNDFNGVTAYVFYTAWYFDRWTSDGSLTYIIDGDSGDSNGKDSMHFYYLNHELRTEVMDIQPKAIFRSQYVYTVNWHGAVRAHPLSDKVLNLLVSDYKKYGFVHHFRQVCNWKFYDSECAQFENKTTLDSTLRNIKRQFF